MRVNREENGSAMIIALLIMALLLGFTALAISRTNSETAAASNDAAESRVFDASHACLEIMTQNFNKIFDVRLNPDPADFTRIEGQTPPGFDEYTFAQDITQKDPTGPVFMTEGQYQGLTALRDGWELKCPVEDENNVGVTLQRRFFNNRIPIFQFGIFYDDDLEFHPGPRFDFGGRVHSNGSLFMAASTRLNFSSKVTAVRHVFTDVQKNNMSWSNWNDEVFIKDASGVYRQLEYNQGSVLQNPVNGVPKTDNPLPTAYENANWATQQARFQGNLLAGQRPLELPLQLNSDNNELGLGLIELIKRGKSVGDLHNDGTGVPAAPNIVPVTAVNDDDLVTSAERYYNKTGIRINLADSKARLPGCVQANGVAVVGPCGVRLDGAADGQGGEPAAGPPVAPRGYLPEPMGGPAYQATRINGDRFFMPGINKQVWIKIETVNYNAATQTFDAVDITEDLLSLGVTERGAVINDPAYNAVPAGGDATDARSIIQLQRFRITGAQVPRSAAAPNNYITWAGTNNYVVGGNIPFANPEAACSNVAVNPIAGSGNTSPLPMNGFVSDNRVHWKSTNIIGVATSARECIVPFPINMFDTREGLYNDTTATFDPGAYYGATNVPWAGVMSLVEINVGNLRRFMRGDYNGGAGNPSLPLAGTPFSVANNRALRSTDIPNANGIVLYISDRRGDFDFDGQYDMEDVYGPNNGNLDPGEDVNDNTSLQAEYTNEAVRYLGTRSNGNVPNQFQSADMAAVFEHRHYRRGVRLVNGRLLPGQLDLAPPPNNTRGFTVASENAVYVLGNYNADSIDAVGTPTPANQYNPLDTVDHIPASIAADAVMILSNGWQDGVSFASPWTRNNRPATETFIRFAMLTGDTRSSLNGTPNQGGGNPRMAGGVHNFKRFLEDWTGVRLNYSGSLINLFNSQNNNAPFKCCVHVYEPPNRNWVFDSTFLNPSRIPPGTPFFQALQITGFERKN